MKLLPFAGLVSVLSACAMQVGVKDSYSYAKIRLPEELVITKKQALEISDEAPKDGALPETLILIPAKDNTYHYALVQYPAWGNEKQHVHDCATKKPALCPICDTRVLKIIPQILYQPRLPALSLQLFFQNLLGNIQKTKRLPYLTASIIHANSIISVIGDLHCHEGALRKIMRSIGKIDSNRLLTFLGDYGDRGPFGPEILCKLIQLAARYKGQVELLRGNHETLSVAQYYDLFNQMRQSAHLYDSSNETLLTFIFESLAQGLLLCIPPQYTSPEKKLPYHCLFLCHAGFDSLIPLKECIMQVIQNHKKTDATELHFDFEHLYPEQSGLLWTDFRANRSPEEPAMIEVSDRSSEGSPDMYCYNYSAVKAIFDELKSEDPNHPFILDGVLRGHWPLEEGIGRLNTKPSTKDWIPLEDQKTEGIDHGSVYTIASSNKHLYNTGPQSVSYADVRFSREKQQWQLTPYIFSKPRKSVPTPPPYNQENEDPASRILTFDESSK